MNKIGKLLKLVVCTLGLNAGAFMSEIIRAGIESISKGQIEGAQSVGMTYLQRMRYVVLPQAFANVAPPLLGQTAVLIIKGASIVSVIGIAELVGAGEHATQSHPRELMLFYGMTALLYFAYCYPVLRLARWAETKYGSIRLPS